jgi:hypothetical protein
VENECAYDKMQQPQFLAPYVKHLGESKIIRTIGTYFAVGYTAGWA